MFYILRHGRTDWNEEHRLQGEVDIPLNETGRQMAYDAAEKYKDIDFDICYCSPLKRAQETARIFLADRNPAVEIITDNRLHEMCFGDYEGVKNIRQSPNALSTCSLRSRKNMWQRTAQRALRSYITEQVSL